MAAKRRRLRWIAAIAGALLVAVVVFFGCRRQGGKHGFRLQQPIPPSGPAFASALYQSVGVRMAPGHQVTLLDNGAVFDALVQEIAKAKSSVHIVMYIWEKGSASDRVVAALVERAKKGIACRILVDAFGSPDFGKKVQAPLVDAGCEVRVFRPLPGIDKLARNHRKIAVVDGLVAITGGFGVRDNWLGDGVSAKGWRDENVRFTGPAVADAQQAFAENWQEAGGALLPAEAFPAVSAAEATGSSSAAFVTSTESNVVTKAERLTQLLIGAARKRIWITNAYFVPSRAILDQLVRKASEGVDVRVLAPGANSDSKTAFGAQHFDFDELLAKGARVWEYLPSMIHSKTMVVDDELVIVGSINLDPLSLTKLDEAALIVEDRSVAEQLAARFTADCAHAHALTNQ